MMRDQSCMFCATDKPSREQNEYEYGVVRGRPREQTCVICHQEVLNITLSTE